MMASASNGQLPQVSTKSRPHYARDDADSRQNAAAQGVGHDSTEAFPMAALQLTRAESSIVRALASQPGRHVTRENLLAAMNESSLSGLSRSVDVHVARVRSKLRAARAPVRIATIHGSGYQWVDDRQVSLREPLGFRHLFIDLSARRVIRDDDLVPLTSRELDVLATLLERRGTVVSRAELRAATSTNAGDAQGTSLYVHVSHLRTKLGDQDPSRPFIRTVHGKGWTIDRLVGHAGGHPTGAGGAV